MALALLTYIILRLRVSHSALIATFGVVLMCVSAMLILMDYLWEWDV